MLLTIDIGNTSIYNGVFNKRVLKKVFRISAYSSDIKALYARNLRSCIGKIDRVIVTSVVPEALKKVEAAINFVAGIDCLVVGRDLESGVKNLYKKPSQVGTDRLVNARAAYELYGGPCVIVDFGTAITIDIVNKNREYLGGVIAPGPGISLWALSEKTALLPRVKLGRPSGILGRETKESMQIGVIYGFSSLCDGIVRRLKRRYCKTAKVVITGGFSELVGPYCETADRIDPDLTLKGLELISR